MINFRNYVKDAVNTELQKLKVNITINEIDAIIDSIIFDWNEIGDPDANFEELVEWNVDQYLAHA
tara:strand:- start:929 stop:1123 length:195 start_codon:yes stop_codon:yes gene_type:complete